MIIIRDDEKVARYKKWAQRILIIGLLSLVGGMILLFVLSDNPNVIFYQTLALLAGWILAQIGTYLAHRYVRSPRPDETLDKAVKPVASNGRMYHFILPASHVLLTPSGPIVLNLKFQNGEITYKDGKWKQRGIGLRRFFGQEGLGNPGQEAESMVKSLAGFIHEEAPEIAEVPIGALIVFTTEKVKSLDVEESEIPAMHYTKLRKFLRREGFGKPLPDETYQTLKTIFDKKAEEAGALE